MHTGFKTAFSVHQGFRGHKHQNFVRNHHKASRIYPVYAISVPLTVRDIPGIGGQSHYFYYRSQFSYSFPLSICLVNLNYAATASNMNFIYPKDLNIFFPAPHIGHFQSSGKFLNGVPF
jgi:hypothetical protein